jgi:hypothetical protein
MFVVDVGAGVGAVFQTIPDTFAGYPCFEVTEVPKGPGILRCNVDTKELWREITHDPEPEPEPTVTMESLQEENKLLKAQVQAQSDRSDFLEDCIAEMALEIY